MDKDRDIGGYYSTREGDKGAKPLYCSLFTHIEINLGKVVM